MYDLSLLMDGLCILGLFLFYCEYDRIWVGVVLNYGDFFCVIDFVVVFFCICCVVVEDMNYVFSFLFIFYILLLFCLWNCRFFFNIFFCVVDCD